MLRCPDKSTLYAYVDGEVSKDLRHLLDVHARSCGLCREDLESISKVQGALFERPVMREPVHFDAKFKERLLHRLSTGEEIRRSYRLDPVVTAAAALLLVLSGAALYGGWKTWSDSNPSLKTGSVTSMSTATLDLDSVESEEGARAKRREVVRLQASFETFLAEQRGAFSAAALEKLDNYESRFEKIGRKLAPELTRLLSAGTRNFRSSVFEALRHRGDPSSISSLRRFLRDPRTPADEKGEALAVCVSIGGPRVREIVMEQERRGYPTLLALQSLLQIDSGRVWSDVERLLKRVDPADLPAAYDLINRRQDEEADIVLRRAFLEGNQSDALSEDLIQRSGTRRWARLNLRRRAGGTAEQARLIEILGRMKDAQSLDLIARSLRQDALFEGSVRALMNIGTPEAWNLMAGRLPHGPARHQDAEAEQRTLFLTGCIKSLGSGAADHFLEMARVTAGRKGRQFVAAVGICGDALHVASLRRLASRHEYELCVIDALVAIGGLRAQAALEDCAQHGDASLRALARRRLAGDRRQASEQSQLL